MKDLNENTLSQDLNRCIHILNESKNGGISFQNKEFFISFLYNYDNISCSEILDNISQTYTYNSSETIKDRLENQISLLKNQLENFSSYSEDNRKVHSAFLNHNIEKGISKIKYAIKNSHEILEYLNVSRPFKIGDNFEISSDNNSYEKIKLLLSVWLRKLQIDCNIYLEQFFNHLHNEGSLYNLATSLKPINIELSKNIHSWTIDLAKVITEMGKSLDIPLKESDFKLDFGRWSFSVSHFIPSIKNGIKEINNGINLSSQISFCNNIEREYQDLVAKFDVKNIILFLDKWLVEIREWTINSRSISTKKSSLNNKFSGSLAFERYNSSSFRTKKEKYVSLLLCCLLHEVVNGNVFAPVSLDDFSKALNLSQKTQKKETLKILNRKKIKAVYFVKAISMTVNRQDRDIWLSEILRLLSIEIKYYDGQINYFEENKVHRNRSNMEDYEGESKKLSEENETFKNDIDAAIMIWENLPAVCKMISRKI